MKQITVNLLRALVLSLVVDVSGDFAQGMGYGWLTITNPAPGDDDFFGVSVVAVGHDRVLIGALRDDTGIGAAHLFSTNGVLLTTFTNPTPANFDWFGCSVAAVGSDRVLIGAARDDTGATDAGAAYLFDTGGALLTTFTNPAPTDGDYFGHSVGVVDADKVLIGAYRHEDGAVYLFSTNGALLTTFTNPSPADFGFGSSSTPVGNGVLIGSPRDSTAGYHAGAAYLYNTNGTLVRTFTNPDSTHGQFGWSVAAVGADRVLIGAYDDDIATTNRPGAAYLFGTNGTLLKTFTNPTPENEETFGSSVAAVGEDQLLIVGYKTDYVGNVGSGTVYVYNTNGVRLTAIANPTSAPNDFFGVNPAPVGTDRVLIGAPSNDRAARDAGVAYLINIAPRLTAALTSTNTIAVAWPSPWEGWTLQENTDSVSSLTWSNAPGPIQDDGTNKMLIVLPPTDNRFYRLFKP